MVGAENLMKQGSCGTHGWPRSWGGRLPESNGFNSLGTDMNVAFLRGEQVAESTPEHRKALNSRKNWTISAINIGAWARCWLTAEKSSSGSDVACALLQKPVALIRGNPAQVGKAGPVQLPEGRHR